MKGRARQRFDLHVATVLGIDVRRSEVLLAGLRERVVRRDYLLRAAGFLAATTFPGMAALPAGLRRRAVRGLVRLLLERPADVLYFLGETDQPPSGSCRGMSA